MKDPMPEPNPSLGWSETLSNSSLLLPYIGDPYTPL